MKAVRLSLVVLMTALFAFCMHGRTDNNFSQKEEFLCDGQPIVCSFYLQCAKKCDNNRLCAQQCFELSGSECQKCQSEVASCWMENQCVDDGVIMGPCSKEYCSDEVKYCLGPASYKRDCPFGFSCGSYQGRDICLKDGDLPQDTQNCNPQDLCSCAEGDFCLELKSGQGKCVTFCHNESPGIPPLKIDRRETGLACR